jgi:hypothetical protein
MFILDINFILVNFFSGFIIIITMINIFTMFFIYFIITKININIINL